jgi:hypothetical protein
MRHKVGWAILAVFVAISILFLLRGSAQERVSAPQGTVYYTGKMLEKPKNSMTPRVKGDLK